ncbi:MAG: type II toxin-antitoxin system VapC family toxin [Rhodoglobus sp.]
MIYLLDTHLLLWAAGDPERLSPAARSLIEDEASGLMFSSAAPWEVAIKSTLGRADFAVDARLFRRGLLENGYTELPIDSRHAVATAELPEIHKDPFDRILVAQARIEGLVLLTTDPIVAEYGSPVELV